MSAFVLEGGGDVVGFEFLQLVVHDGSLVKLGIKVLVVCQGFRAAENPVGERVEVYRERDFPGLRLTRPGLACRLRIHVAVELLEQSVVDFVEFGEVEKAGVLKHQRHRAVELSHDLGGVAAVGLRVDEPVQRAS